MPDNAIPLTVAPAPEDSTVPPCPSWCVNSQGPEFGFHRGPGARLSQSTTLPAPMEHTLLAEIMQMVDGEDEFPRDPIIWVEGGGSLELDRPGLDTYIAALEQYLLELRGLRRQLVDFTGRATQHSGQGPLVERTMPCPPWCNGREFEDDGSPNEHLEDRGHCCEMYTLELELEKGQDGEVQIDLEQPAFAHRPEMGLMLSKGEKLLRCRFSVPEARQLADALTAMATQADRHATPDFLPPLQDVLDSVRAQVYDDPALPAHAPGYTLGDLTSSGKVWVAVPKGLPPEPREVLIRKLLGHMSDNHRKEHADTGPCPTSTAVEGRPPTPDMDTAAA